MDFCTYKYTLHPTQYIYRNQNMDTKPLNPLAKHFRQPAIYFKLPSKGQFWTEGSLEIPVTGEIPVYPMTARDEITLRTPDALLNGQGVIDVIQSCCPNIKDAWRMPSVDVDVTLIAIRIASYGPHMNINAKCPHCEEEHDYDVELSPIMDSIKMPQYSEKITAGDVKIKLRPQEYFSVNQTDQIRFEEQRIINALSDTSIPEDDRLAAYSQHMEKIVNLNLKILTDSTEYIEGDENAIVTDRSYIEEFYNNCETKIVNDVQERLAKLLETTRIQPVDASCTSCEKDFKLPLKFDYSSFFGSGS
jgi:T4 bacteriophage base plate protein